MDIDTDAEKFNAAISEEPCCATCKFFVSDNLITRMRDNGSSNRVWGFRIEGECQRYPKQVTKQGSFHHEEESHWGFPPVVVKAEEFSQEDGNFSQVTSGDFSWGERPWCGEYAEHKHGFESWEFLNGEEE